MLECPETQQTGFEESLYYLSVIILRRFVCMLAWTVTSCDWKTVTNLPNENESSALYLSPWNPAPVTYPELDPFENHTNLLRVGRCGNRVQNFLVGIFRLNCLLNLFYTLKGCHLHSLLREASFCQTLHSYTSSDTCRALKFLRNSMSLKPSDLRKLSGIYFVCVDFKSFFSFLCTLKVLELEPCF